MRSIAGTLPDLEIRRGGPLYICFGALFGLMLGCVFGGASNGVLDVLLCNESVCAVALDELPRVSTTLGEWADAAETLPPSSAGAAGSPSSGEVAESELQSALSAAIVRARVCAQ